MKLSRRSLLQASLAVPFAASGARAAERVTVKLGTERLHRIPEDFMGLGYEASSVAVKGLLSADNRPYVRLVRNLGRRGVIRIGGNVSDYSSWEAQGVSANDPKATVLTRANLRQLRGFLDATGWSLIWGLNLGADRLDNAVEEAKAVAAVMGPRLKALEVGNEPDLFSRNGHRRNPYGYNEWHADYRRYRDAIRAALPRIPFAGPDVAGATEWVEAFARDEGGDAALLTAHHYITGQANPATSIDLMLQEEKKYQPALARMQAAASGARLPWRMCETASFSGGGREGVSDTFAAALWALDYLFVLASYGCAGVNMETGVNHLGWLSHYTPIAQDQAGFRAAPEYYGLLAFAVAGRGDLLHADCNPGGINLTAYATGDGGRTMLTVINKDQTRDAMVEITSPRPVRQARVLRLMGSSPSAKSGIVLGAESVGPDGGWRGGNWQPVRAAGAGLVIELPAASAALVAV
jgi:hypothetical protein